jgi:dTDP-glucose 4,6-dehydratase
MRMTLLVTGGAGFIGSHFIKHWLEHHPEDSVVNLDSLSYAGNLENLDAVKDNPNYRFVKGDVADRELVFDLVKDIDIVVHFAAESHVDRSIMGVEPFIHSNVLGTAVLLDAVHEHGKRMHHVSTDEVYGTLSPEDPPFSETTPYAPRNPYSATKAAADHMVRAYYETHGVPVTISNCSNNYGPQMFPEKFMPLFICNLLEGKKVPVYGDGLQKRDWIWVLDHVRGIEAVIEKGKIGETYCFGGTSEIPNIDVTKMMIELTGRDESFIEYVKDRPGHDRRYDIDYSKAKRELGWEPQIGLKDGLAMMVEWYKENQAWVERCRSGAYRDYYKQQYEER